jgi:inhibitor of KinA sporulation pathway (predicted exonuclease)
MACHVYDSTYCHVMTIFAQMQLEDVAALSVLWKNLNAVLAKHGIPEPKFKGFMVDYAQANWNAV